MCKDSLIVFIGFSTLRVVREIQNGVTLKFHPKISFSVDHDPSPSMRFFISAGFPPFLTDLWGGTKISWVEIRIALVMCLRRALDGFCAIPMKILM